MPVSKVYILTNSLLAGGAEKQSVMLAALLKKQYNVTLIVYYGKETDSKLLRLTQEYEIDPLFLDGSHLAKWRQLFGLFRENKNAVVFSYLATTNFVNALIGRFAGVRYLVGGIRTTKLSKAKFLVQRLLHNRFLSYSVFNSYEGRAKLSAEGFKKDKIVVIHNCIDIKQKKRIDFSWNIFNIITVGRFVPDKDYFTALESIRNLLQLIEKANLAVKINYRILGYGELEKEIRDKVLELGLGEVVEIIINPRNIEEYLSQANVYLSASLNEGLSNSILEAMEFSLPIVATNVGDNAYLVEDGLNGFTMGTQSPEVIAEKLFYILSRKDEGMRMGTESYDKLVTNFTGSVFFSRYFKFIDGLDNK